MKSLVLLAVLVSPAGAQMVVETAAPPSAAVVAPLVRLSASPTLLASLPAAGPLDLSGRRAPLWSLPEGLSAKETGRRPGRASAESGWSRASAPFDNSLSRGAFLAVGVDAAAPVRRLPPDLAAAARPWKTKTQLERIQPVAPDGTVRFAVLGDAEPGRFVWSRVLFNRKGVYQTFLQRLRGENVSFVMQLGDMVSRGVPRNYRKLFKTLNGSGLQHPYVTVLGNHDRQRPHGNANADLYLSMFGDPNYAFDVGGTRFVVVDSSLHKLTQAQLRWLDAVLDTDKKKIVFTHIPPNQIKQWTHGVGGIKKGGLAFVDLMAKRKVDRVYMGHVHLLGTTEIKGVKYVLSGGGGSPLYPSTAPRRLHHYLVIESGPNGVTETVHPLKGESFPVVWKGRRAPSKPTS